MSGTPKHNKQVQQRQREREICNVRNCHRPAYARGICQTHHRQVLTTGKLKRIRPYRKRSPGTVKFGGLRLSPSCAEKVQRLARKEGLSDGAAIAQILEEWCERTQSQRPVKVPLASPEQ